ncbi:formate/nitrite transporter family protein [Ruania halotolerans]|uniref:formate/nitrite transporter family protein n=1 Tax=Ruania halotolerans TaxID=2897773 RepID=UPI001E33E5EA|nr:formate/nitrite transporter family protein [Ruania halotolerans]UFU06668.1 formate/nitrite transporter family protein [Ruania halotolerans]
MVDDKRQRERMGDTDLDIEEELVVEAATTVTEGTKRLNRTWVELIVTGLFGGIDIGLGILAMILVKQATDSDILAGMAFGVGLLALKLAHSELFTEEFLLPINAIVAGQGTWPQLLRLWSATLVGNLTGGVAFAWLTVLALPNYHGTLIESANEYLDPGSTGAMIGLSLLAGATITLSTRMQQGTSNDVVVALICLASGLLVIGLGMLHGALNAIVIFAAMFAGADITLWQFLSWFGVVIVFNMLGGLLVITVPRLARTHRVLRAVRNGELSLEKLEEEAA